MVNAAWGPFLLLQRTKGSKLLILDSSNKYLRFTSLGFQMIVIIGIGAAIGYFIDQKTNNTKHLYTAFITLLFVVIALYTAIKSIINDK